MRLGVALAALSALLYWGACPPVDLWPLAFVCWVPLLVALRGRSPREALFLGGVQGLVANVAMFAWLPEVVRTFGPLSLAACWVVSVLACAYNAGSVAIVAWLYARSARNGWPAGVAFVLAVAATEALYPVVFPSYAAVHVHRLPLLMQLAELGGPVLVGVPLAMANVGVAERFASRLDGRPVDRVRVALAAAGPLAALLYGALRIPVVDARIAAAPAARVAIIQANVPHAGTTLQGAIDLHRDASVRVEAAGPVDLLVWPETALASVIDARELETTLRDLVVRAPGGPLAFHAPVLSGAMLERGKAFANSAVLFDPDGTVRGVYDKARPLVIGEYVPLGDRYPQLYTWIHNAGHLTAGSVDQPPLLLGPRARPISALICYEDILADYTNAVVRSANPELLVNLTNDSWFGRSAAAEGHYAEAKLRAVEHRRFLVVASNSGVSGFVDPVGRSTQETALLEAATRVGEIRWMSAPTLYERIGDAPWWGAAVAVIAMSVVRRRSRTRRHLFG